MQQRRPGDRGKKITARSRIEHSPGLVPVIGHSVINVTMKLMEPGRSVEPHIVDGTDPIIFVCAPTSPFMAGAAKGRMASGDRHPPAV
jgi:hypothetical protein